LIPDLSGLVITASVIWVLRFKVACCNSNLTEITDDHPQSRPRRQLCESAARAALLPAGDTQPGTRSAETNKPSQADLHETG
jgi:hypothetical protein